MSGVSNPAKIMLVAAASIATVKSVVSSGGGALGLLWRFGEPQLTENTTDIWALGEPDMKLTA